MYQLPEALKTRVDEYIVHHSGLGGDLKSAGYGRTMADVCRFGWIWWWIWLVGGCCGLGREREGG